MSYYNTHCYKIPYIKSKNLTKKQQALCGLQAIFPLFNCQTSGSNTNLQKINYDISYFYIYLALENMGKDDGKMIGKIIGFIIVFSFIILFNIKDFNNLLNEKCEEYIQPRKMGGSGVFITLMLIGLLLVILDIKKTELLFVFWAAYLIIYTLIFFKIKNIIKRRKDEE